MLDNRSSFSPNLAGTPCPTGFFTRAITYMKTQVSGIFAIILDSLVMDIASQSENHPTKVVG